MCKTIFIIIHIYIIKYIIIYIYIYLLFLQCALFYPTPMLFFAPTIEKVSSGCTGLHLALRDTGSRILGVETRNTLADHGHLYHLAI